MFKHPNALEQHRIFIILVAMALLGCALHGATPSQPDFPPLEKVTEGYKEVVTSTPDSKPGLFRIWTREKDGQMLAAMPRGFDKKRFFIALTVASGEDFAGLQSGDMYVYWRRYDKRLAMVEPNVRIRSTGDPESRESVKRLYTDKILLDVPIVAMAGSSPVIDMDALLVGQAYKFFRGVRVQNPRLARIKSDKSFPDNIEIAFEVPTSSGRLQVLHYSISVIPERSSYKPRKADTRVGYFTTSYSDYGQFKEQETRVRYINRWYLKKRDPQLELSPPVEPIKFYIEHTTPVRYRRWIKQGVEYWNKAFEEVGIAGAIEVEYQDSRSGAHMEKDPEDVRYNFIRWLSNNQGTAIGPSRVHPETGQILDADIILTDGWIRHWWQEFHEVMPEMALEGVSADRLAWFGEHPQWDPRILLVPPSQRKHVCSTLAEHHDEPHAGHPAARVETNLLGDEEYDGLAHRTCQLNGGCRLARGRGFDVTMFRMLTALGDISKPKTVECCDPNDPNTACCDPNDPNAVKDPNEAEEDEEEKAKPQKKVPMIDGIPEEFIGPLMADLVCHEVGHTLGLRHNFKASALYTMAEINSEEIKGKKPLASSVMDYLPVNINFEDGEVQGDYAMIAVGPYDEWAIEYGYTERDSDAEKVLQRVAEPELQYGTDEDTWGPDPLTRRYDFSKDPVDYARNQLRIAKHTRGRIVGELVEDGDSWAKARDLYEMTLMLQFRAMVTVAPWIGGAHVYRDKKGDKNGRLPIEVVPVEKQREVLSLILENGFRDEVYGLDPNLIKRLTVDKWWDDMSSLYANPAWPIHDTIMGLQSVLMVQLMNPTTLGQIYDNEFMVPKDEDALTLPELLNAIQKEIWSELEQKRDGIFTARQPMISSLRRNLQQQHVSLLIDLTRTSTYSSAAAQAIAELAVEQLDQIQNQVGAILSSRTGNLDSYTRAHLKNIEIQIKRAQEAMMIYRSL